MIILLCGGAGTRFDTDIPKPMNLINGIPLIYYTISSLNYNKLCIFYNYKLNKYGFKQYLINTFKYIEFIFIEISFQTRGPVETILLGCKQLNFNKNEQLIFIDNDNIYNGFNYLNLPSQNFIAYKDNNTLLRHYSFISMNNKNDIINIEERNEISNYICMGIYGFENIDICMKYCNLILNTCIEEPYISYVFKKMIEDNIIINSYYIPDAISLGTPNDILINKNKIPYIKLRIVFDLDNTIVTYPNIYKDYSTVDKIEYISKIIKYLKSIGHTIIIYTARNMNSSDGNVGKVLKNVGKITLDTLEKMNIEYDEIIFGKPYGDIYIDDKAYNCFDEKILTKMGFYDSNIYFDEFKTNKYNKIYKNGNNITKIGPKIEGELFFYRIISKYDDIKNLFPKFISSDTNESITIEYISGTELSKIYYEGLLNKIILNKLFNVVNEFHKYDIDEKNIFTENDIYNHYYNKLNIRIKNKEDYPFDDFDEIYNKIKNNLDLFLNKKYKLNNIIHGDLWFSNIMFFKNNFKFYDMRGIFNDKLSIKGHTIYDWSKLYQSIIGLDSIILYGDLINDDIRNETEIIFKEFLTSINIDFNDVKNMTAYLIFNTFHSYDKDFPLYKKNMIWSLVKYCL